MPQSPSSQTRLSWNYWFENKEQWSFIWLATLYTPTKRSFALVKQVCFINDKPIMSSETYENITCWFERCGFWERNVMVKQCFENIDLNGAEVDILTQPTLSLTLTFTHIQPHSNLHKHTPNLRSNRYIREYVNHTPHTANCAAQQTW